MRHPDSQQQSEIDAATKWLRAIMKREGITEMTIKLDEQKVKFGWKAKPKHRLKVANPCD